MIKWDRLEVYHYESSSKLDWLCHERWIKYKLNGNIPFNELIELLWVKLTVLWKCNRAPSFVFPWCNKAM